MKTQRNQSLGVNLAQAEGMSDMIGNQNILLHLENLECRVAKLHENE